MYYQNNENQINSNHTSLYNLYLQISEYFVPILLNANLSLNETLLTFLLYVKETWITQLILTISQ